MRYFRKMKGDVGYLCVAKVDERNFRGAKGDNRSFEHEFVRTARLDRQHGEVPLA